MTVNFRIDRVNGMGLPIVRFRRSMQNLGRQLRLSVGEWIPFLCPATNLPWTRKPSAAIFQSVVEAERNPVFRKILKCPDKEENSVRRHLLSNR